MHAEQQKMVDRIISELEKGVIPWRKQFKASKSATGLPYNAVSGASYRGLNIIQLLMTGRPIDGGWLTYKQAIACGGHVRKGEKSTIIFYYSRAAKKDSTPQDPKYFFMARSYLVFHLEQCENIDATKLHQFPENGIEVSHNERNARADEYISAIPAKINYSARTVTPCYIPAVDRIEMPLFEQFESADAFYSTSIHELTHWTGKRLKRDLSGRFGSSNYALEELTAELCVCFTLPQFGLNNEGKNFAYLQNWITALREKPDILSSVASAAATANAFLNAFSDVADASNSEGEQIEGEEIEEAA